MQIFVRIVGGKRISIQCEPTDTILKVKEIIEEAQGLSIDKQRISMVIPRINNKYIKVEVELDNKKTLNYYNIKNDDSRLIVMYINEDTHPLSSYENIAFPHVNDPSAPGAFVEIEENNKNTDPTALNGGRRKKRQTRRKNRRSHRVRRNKENRS